MKFGRVLVRLRVLTRWRRNETGHPHHARPTGCRFRVRLKAPRPAIRVESASDPRNVFFLVRLDVLRNKDVRTQRYGSGLSFSAPAKEYDVPFDLEKATDGAWAITPRQLLRPAEYGIFTVLSREQQSTALYGFGVE